MNDLTQTPTTTKPIKVPNKKRQRNFIEAYFNPESPTYGNAYESATKAGFSKSTARVITTNAKGLHWIQEAKQLYSSTYSPAHIIKGFEHITQTARADRDKIQALDRLAKIHGMYIERVEQNVNVKFTNSVPRPVIEVEQPQQPPIQP